MREGEKGGRKGKGATEGEGRREGGRKGVMINLRNI